MKKILFCVFWMTLFAVAGIIAQPNAGKIWIEGSKIFINIPGKGVQVIDRSDPDIPEPLGFIAIPNNIDFAVYDEIMYANHFEDLVVFDWEAFLNDDELIEFGRFENMFPEYADKSDEGDLAMGMMSSKVSVVNSTGGSQSRFAFDNTSSPDYLYAASQNAINVIDVRNADRPNKTNEVALPGNTIETTFVEGDRLYLGMPNGMSVFSLDNLTLPSYEGRYEHMVGCDPVVVDRERAYVTVRSGTTCGSRIAVNQLHIVNVSNASNLTLEESFPLSNPHGLGIDGNLLFICDGSAGVKVLDVTNPSGIRLLSHTETPGVAYDVIVDTAKRQLTVVSGDYVLQYKYSATGQLDNLGEYHIQY